ncbi:MAG: alpha-glucan family phosphorylase [Halobacteriota archaeon]|nr:alpha-glucan family phosphorylase [Halobacteriota archaeon]
MDIVADCNHINKPQIALFSMEVGMDHKIPTYSGGLGVLAGDILRSCADLNVPIVGITLACNKGYLTQRLDDEGNQTELPVEWRIDDFTNLMSSKVTVPIAGKEVKIQAWEYIINGIEGHQVPVYLLDTNIFENEESDRGITYHLYGGDQRYRLAQEIVLGIGGVRMLKAMGHDIKCYHMNEGHSALVPLELIKRMREENNGCTIGQIIDLVRGMCIFTTHTPVPAGHDKFNSSLVKELLGSYLDGFDMNRICHDDVLNMTLLALDHSEHINGVAKKHGEISRSMFPGYPISSITNGVHHIFWTSEPFRELYDRTVPGWRRDPFNLRYILSVKREEIVKAHEEAKKDMVDLVNSNNRIFLDYDVFTIGFARRMTKYKRPDLIFTDPGRLLGISRNVGPLQIVFAGKSHINDGVGKDIIRKIFSVTKSLKDDIKIVFLQDYDMELAKSMISGVDLWLNTPKSPNEASGTSGMKATFNGIPSLSILDGWWVEGCIEGVTGWAIGADTRGGSFEETDDSTDAEYLYKKLERVIIPKYYKDYDSWAEVMQHVIAFNSSFFNSHRMVQQYLMNAYCI